MLSNTEEKERLESVGRVAWDAMLPELQTEVLWIMQRQAQRGEPEWITALAMLRRTALREWHRHVPPLPGAGIGRVTTIPKIASVAAMLAVPLRAGDWPLFQELVVWRKAMGKPVNLSVSFQGNNMSPVHQALGYQSNPDLFERFVALAGAGTMPYEKFFLHAVVQGVCERGMNTAWFKELVSSSLRTHEMSSVARHCARYGQLEWLRYLHEKGCPWDAGTCEHAAQGGHLDCLRYARENGCPWDTWTCWWAAKGHLDCLRYAHENGCPWEAGTCEHAAKGGHLDCLRYAHENGCPWDKWTCTRAAEGGHRDCLRYAHENGCPWDEWTCERAAAGGHLDCLRYVHDRQCPWNGQTCWRAAEGGHLDCLRYAIEAGCPMPWRKAQEIAPVYIPTIRAYLNTRFK